MRHKIRLMHHEWCMMLHALTGVKHDVRNCSAKWIEKKNSFPEFKYDTIRYAKLFSFAQKLTGSQLNVPHGTRKQKEQWKTKNKLECWQLTCQFPTWQSPAWSSSDRRNYEFRESALPTDEGVDWKNPSFIRNPHVVISQQSAFAANVVPK